MRSTHLPLVILLAGLGVALPSSEAAAYCTIGASNLGLDQYQWDAADMPVPVYLVAPAATILGHDSDAVGRMIGRAIDQINRYGMSNLRLRFAGVRPTGAGVGEVGIFVNSTNNCSACGAGVAACTNFPTLDPSDNVINVNIRFVYNPTSCSTHDWQFYPDYAGCQPGACADDMQATMTHELLHAVGFAHSGNFGHCAPGDNGSEGVMHVTGKSEHRNLSRDDIAGLVSLYGRLDATLDYHYSYDGGLSWSDGGVLGAQATFAAPGSVSKATEGEAEVWMGHHAASSWVGRVQAMTSAAVSPAVAVGALSTFHPVASALGDGTVVSARWVDATRTNNSKTLRWAWSTDSGATWAGADALRNDADTVQSRRNGLGVAYDPKTARFVAAYLGDDNVDDATDEACDDDAQPSYLCDEIRLVSILSDGTSQRHTDVGIRSAVAPQIACGDTTATNNCVLTWVSTTANACVHWAHGRLDGGGNFVRVNDLATDCYQGFGPVGVLHDPNEPARPWRIALTQEVVGIDDRIYTLRKDGSTAAAWTDQRSFAVANGFRVLGDLGLVFTGSAEKLVAVYARE
jgi:hypothetical protein